MFQIDIFLSLFKHLTERRVLLSHRCCFPRLLPQNASDNLSAEIVLLPEVETIDSASICKGHCFHGKLIGGNGIQVLE